MKKNNIFMEDIEIPEIVQSKVNDALAQIKMEEADIMTEKNKAQKIRKRKTIFKSQAAVVAGICILAASSITAVAAVHHFWSRGMRGNIQATQEQQQILKEQGVATELEETENYDSMAVTIDGVTVKPMETIVDGHFAYVSFSVEGYTLKEGEVPGFEMSHVYLGDDPYDVEGRLNMGASFYSGIVSDGNGKAIYDDGTPLEFTDDGSIVERYVTEDGRMEYVMFFYSSDVNKSMIGETVHIRLENLGNVYKAGYENGVIGTWDFDITLSGKNAGVAYEIGEKLENTAFTIDTIEFSPISIRVNYTVEGEVDTTGYQNGVPSFYGVILKDGTKLPFIVDGGMSGYTDETKQSAYELKTFDRVLDVEQIQSLIFGMAGMGEEYIVDIP